MLHDKGRPVLLTDIGSWRMSLLEEALVGVPVTGGSYPAGLDGMDPAIEWAGEERDRLQLLKESATRAPLTGGCGEGKS